MSATMEDKYGSGDWLVVSLIRRDPSAFVERSRNVRNNGIGITHAISEISAALDDVLLLYRGPRPRFGLRGLVEP